VVETALARGIVVAHADRPAPQSAPMGSPRHPEDSEESFALGIDAGGSGTRWALMAVRPSLGASGAAPRLVAEGEGAALSGTQLLEAAGELAADVALGGIARALPELPHAVVAGLTGYDHALAPRMLPRLTQIFGVEARAAKAMSDIELLCGASFAPGEGIVVYAGTGSIAAHLDAMAYLHRAGGRGAVIDDAGGGYWIAREALRRIWRAEDEEPGAWQRSPLAQAFFEQLGGPEWARTRHWVYGASRGELGALATVVAAVANKDAAAMALLEQAGRELGRLVLALMRRVGRQPVAVAGRAFALHPAVERGLVAAMPLGTEVAPAREVPHLAAARLALRLIPAAREPAPATPQDSLEETPTVAGDLD
jgi:glucosamine kinase